MILPRKVLNLTPAPILEMGTGTKLEGFGSVSGNRILIATLIYPLLIQT